jgi:2-aminoadipate transaminase
MPDNGVRMHTGQPCPGWQRRDRVLFYDNMTLAERAAKMNSSAIREILKLTDRPGIISMAGGLPSPKAFPWTRSPKPARP